MPDRSHAKDATHDADGTMIDGLFEAAFDTLPLSAVIVDADGTIVTTNRAWRDFARANGGDPDAQLGENYLSVCRSADSHSMTIAARLQEIIDGRRENLELEYPCHSPEQRRWFVMRASRMMLGGRCFVLICHADVTARRLAEEEAFRRAAEDPLTGLLNRRSFHERLAQALNRAERRDRPLAVLFLDLDGFKSVNDRLGHASGDRVLCEAADSLRASLRRVDSLSRIGGDEFAMFLEEVEEEDVLRVAERIAGVLASNVALGEEHISLGASLGVSFFPRDGDDAQSLLQTADAAMYTAKTQGLKMAIAAHGFAGPSETGS